MLFKMTIETIKNPSSVLLIPVKEGIIISVNGYCTLKPMTPDAMIGLARALLGSAVEARSNNVVTSIPQV